MLVDIDLNTRTNPILDMIAQVNGNPAGIVTVMSGVYTVGHFNHEDIIAPHISFETRESGTCDKVQDILEKYNVKDSKDSLFIIMTPIVKDNQSSEGGWRWHKWGEYIGSGEPKCEYLYDEAEGEFETVYYFTLYREVNAS